MVYIKNM